MADVLQPVVAAVFWQSEADVSGLLPAAADLSELTGQAGQQKDQAAQQDHKGEDQDQSKRGGQVKVVLGWVKGAVPSKYQRVDSGHGQGAVTQRGLQGEKERCQVCRWNQRQPACPPNIWPTLFPFKFTAAQRRAPGQTLTLCCWLNPTTLCLHAPTGFPH